MALVAKRGGISHLHWTDQTGKKRGRSLRAKVKPLPDDRLRVLQGHEKRKHMCP